MHQNVGRRVNNLSPAPDLTIFVFKIPKKFCSVLENECGFKFFLIKLGLDRTSRKQPQVDQVLKVSLHRNLTVNTILFVDP